MRISPNYLLNSRESSFLLQLNYSLDMVMSSSFVLPDSVLNSLVEREKRESSLEVACENPIRTSHI
ncbi:orf2 [Faba bean necrotic yellows C1 alphasatellite]|uniref:Orf2 protein n=1 Tax=Faba bean necrotic yellows C1 alphasatellite TaxID=1453080 RepID=Q66863_FBNC1|nr:orf2 [Faba bean necrotic yellows C1 alphasatellite]CAA56848.1 orf2 [Faba bean necrotic yellows C1 alphasatellite]